MSEKKVEMKICSNCKLIKVESDFYKNGGYAGGVTSSCKECRKKSCRESYAKNPAKAAARHKRWAKENPEKLRAAKRLKLYGLSPQNMDEMLVRQAGKCAICGELLIKPCVDHCHVTGKVRGLLCQGCNTGLGSFKDSSKVLIAAQTYLEKHSLDN